MPQFSQEKSKSPEEWIEVPCYNGRACVGEGVVKVQRFWLDIVKKKREKGPYCSGCRRRSAEFGYSAKMFT